MRYLMNTGYERRMMIVFLLSIGLMIASFYFMPKNKTIYNPKPAGSQPAVLTNASPSTNVSLNTGFGWDKTAVVTNADIAFGNEISAVVDTYGGRISQVFLNGGWNRKKAAFPVMSQATPYKIGDIVFGKLENAAYQTNSPVFRITKLTNKTIELSARINSGPDSFEVTKTFSVSSNYQIFEEVGISNLSRSAVSFNFNGVSLSFPENIIFVSPELANSGNPLIEQYYNGKSLVNSFPAGFLGLFKPPLKIISITNAGWICVKDNYFVTIMRPSFSGYISKFLILRQDKAYKDDAFGVELSPFSIEPRGSKTFDISYYVGPKKEDILNMADGEWLNKNDSGGKTRSYYMFFMWWPVFNWFMKPIEWLLVKLMYIISLGVPNWGLIIILLAIIIKLCLSPLSIQAARSIKRSNLLQPKLKSLQEKYRNDQTTLNQKMAELYKKEKVNPLGGCLPMLLQIPVFFALLRVLSNSVELKGASFLWMSDLTQPDTLFKMSLPILPNTFNLLPIIMTGIQIVQMKLQSMKTVPGSNQQQNALNTYLLPIIFLFIFWSMPAGLVLYWTIQSIYTIFEQEIINLDKHIQLK